jgi:hypothetical protein
MTGSEGKAVTVCLLLLQNLHIALGFSIAYRNPSAVRESYSLGKRMKDNDLGAKPGRSLRLFELTCGIRALLR